VCSQGGENVNMDIIERGLTGRAAALFYLSAAAQQIATAEQMLARHEAVLAIVTPLLEARHAVQQAGAALLANCLSQTLAAIHSSPAEELEPAIDELARLSGLIVSQLCPACRHQVGKHLVAGGAILEKEGKVHDS
jgi:hypothetical protein